MEANSNSHETFEKDPYDFENWYPFLAEFTFKSSFIPLFEEEAIAIRDYFQINTLSINDEVILDDSSRSKIIANLELRIGNAMEPLLKESPDGIFVRLSSRSPKDVAVLSDESKARVTEEMLKHKGEGEIMENIAFLNAVGRCLAVKSPKKAMELLLSSKRVFEDLDFRLLQIKNKTDRLENKPKEIVCMKIILRAFKDDIQREFEMRAFVSNGKLTALTQYYKWCFVPELAKNKLKYEEEIKNFFGIICSFVPNNLPSYVVDFVKTKEGWMVVELNHWAKTTGTGLFNWDTDEELLNFGPFSFRILKQGRSQKNILRTIYGWYPDI